HVWFERITPVLELVSVREMPAGDIATPPVPVASMTPALVTVRLLPDAMPSLPAEMVPVAELFTTRVAPPTKMPIPVALRIEPELFTVQLRLRPSDPPEMVPALLMVPSPIAIPMEVPVTVAVPVVPAVASTLIVTPVSAPVP